MGCAAGTPGGCVVVSVALLLQAHGSTEPVLPHHGSLVVFSLITARCLSFFFLSLRAREDTAFFCVLSFHDCKKRQTMVDW